MTVAFSRYGVIEHCLRPRTNLTLRLYTNDFVPSRAQTLADFKEADFPGYAPITLRPSDFIARDGDPIILQAPLQTFTLMEDLLDPYLIYGYYLTDGDEIVLAEDCRLNNLPRTLQIMHSRFKVTPTLGEK